MIKVAFLGVTLATALTGCSMMDTVDGAIGHYTTRYCRADDDGKQFIRAKLDEVTYPNTIRILCNSQVSTAEDSAPANSGGNPQN